MRDHNSFIFGSSSLDVVLLYGLSVEFSIQYCILGLVGITEHLWSDDNRRYLIIFKVL